MGDKLGIIRKRNLLAASDGVANDGFGSRASISGDWAIVGAQAKNSGEGAAYIFNNDPAGGWTEVSFPEPVGLKPGDSFGHDVDIRDDYSIVGADLTNDNTGAAYVFHGVRKSIASGVIGLDGLVAWYQLDGDGTDSSGNNHHGTVYGASGTQNRFGSADSAMLFDGTDDYVEVFDHPDLNPTDAITVSRTNVTGPGLRKWDRGRFLGCHDVFQGVLIEAVEYHSNNTLGSGLEESRCCTKVAGLGQGRLFLTRP